MMMTALLTDANRIPYTMAKFVVYEKAAETIYRSYPKNTLSDGMQTTVNLGAGLIAGFAAAIVSQPADTMLSKINKSKGLPGESTTSRLVKIAKELGLRGSYTGIGARLVMVGTLTAGQFAIYGDIKKALGATGKNLNPFISLYSLLLEPWLQIGSNLRPCPRETSRASVSPWYIFSATFTDS